MFAILFRPVYEYLHNSKQGQFSQSLSGVSYESSNMGKGTTMSTVHKGAKPFTTDLCNGDHGDWTHDREPVYQDTTCADPLVTTLPPQDEREPMEATMKRLTRTMCLIAILMLFCCAGLVMSFVFLFHPFLNVQMDKLRGPGEDNPVCVPCMKLVKSPGHAARADPLMMELTRQPGVIEEQCCAYNNDQLSALLELSLREQETSKTTALDLSVKDFRFTPVSAHKRLLPPPKKYQDAGLYPRATQIFFNEVNDTLEHQRGVEMLEAGIRIVYGGIYYVYSSVHFQPPSQKPCKEYSNQQWSHAISRIVPNHPMRTGCLLRTTHRCSDGMSGGSETSFTSGIFFFKSGDIITVRISGAGLTVFEPESSFLGLFMLGSQSEHGQDSL